ncbi:DUF1315 family protein [Psychromonas sp. RZ22]|uniref:YeaC family protein n=1 Tax=Psychromonas algarum TaxID=2555643 RepID=UPI00106891B0|nr:DUF1315 family protein [Psychromonas sp. RZ22]TEW56030.1 DUF1315 family protein [Psychromonas sp. RZ22]
MSNINEYAKNITPSLYEKLKTAVETGKWLDGAVLTEEQKAHSLQLVMAYQKEFNEQPDHFTIAQNGEIYMESKKVLKSQFSEETDLSDTHIINL